MAAPHVGWVTLTASDPPARLQVRVVDRPNVTQGYGGWSEVQRPRRSTLTVWQAQPALRMDLPLLFDAYARGGSVERDLALLERLAGPSASDRQPPRVRLAATGLFVPHQDRVWVIDNLAWGDAAMTAHGNRTRQQVIVSLLEYVEDVRVAEDSAANRARFQAAAPKTKQGAAVKRVVAGPARTHQTGTKPPVAREPGRLTVTGLLSGQPVAAAPSPITPLGGGDDLLSIAAKELGDADRWVEIAQLNGIRDPRSIVRGQVIRLP
jgi:hypothetical protein